MKSSLLNFSQYLEEGRDAPLYHATGFSAAQNIMSSNMFRASTYHPSDNIPHKKNTPTRTNHSDGRKIIGGVSLTRNLRFAKAWGDADIIFQLNQTKLFQTYKIVPYNYEFEHTSKPQLFRNEAEEFVIGPIKNANKYIQKIFINADLDRKDKIEQAAITLGIYIEHF